MTKEIKETESSLCIIN